MRAAILCPGPSLQYYLRVRPHSDVVIGVNEAAEAAHCHWWSCVDWESFTRHAPIGDPVKFTTNLNRRRVLTHLGVSLAEQDDGVHHKGWLTHEELASGPRPTGCPRAGKWGTLSATAAIVLAEWLGATEITMYGADMAGDQSYNGPPDHPVHRDKPRWGDEMLKLAPIVEWLEAHGIAFCRNINGERISP